MVTVDWLHYCTLSDNFGRLQKVSRLEDRRKDQIYQSFAISGGGSKTGDMCSQNTDCQSGMYCFNGICTCLSNYVAIAGFCWQKVNPGDSGCVEDKQCEAVWPGAKCSRIGLCDCPEHTVPSKTRDGTVCITMGVPPACPLPEPNNPQAPNPATILANPSTHPLAQDQYMPVLCTSTSVEVSHSNGGDGSSWCVYPDGDKDVFVADMYNCIPHPQVRSEYFPEYTDSIDGICCHSRAFVCIQPMMQGDEPSIPRWWFNAVTGTCSQFLWDPTQSENVSPNNFRTLEHCESYCKDSCKRGPVQFGRHSRHTIPEEVPVTNCLHHSGSCSPEFACTLVGSQQYCCPTIAHICSPAGGRPLSVYQPKDNFDVGVQTAGSSSISRFYYDVEQGRCTNFLYEGGLGNYNNFLTKQDCENFCSKLVCEYGNPLRVGEEWQRCETNADCPGSHSCQSSHRVCCPTAQSICTQPMRVGDCTGAVNRYWYNAAVQQCELFQYTGCQGNDNNFDQLLECQRKCRNIALEPKCPQGRPHRDSNGLFSKCWSSQLSDGIGFGIGGDGDGACSSNHYCHFDGVTHGCCPTKAWTCSLGADVGVQCGSGRSFRYFFNAEKQQCESFQYEGCDGNSNNFQSAESCQDYCGVGGCPNGGQPLRDEKTNQWAVCAPTDGSDCPGTHECVAVNGHNGITVHRCCPTKAYICSLPPQQGNLCTKASITRWYFNIVTKECGKFSFNGCNGNLNNFESADECTNFCSSSACASGEVAYKKDVREELYYDLATDRHARTAQLNNWPSSNWRGSREVLQCSATLTNSCPSDYKCRFDTLTNSHVCCGTPYSDVCPVGEKPFVHASDESLKECAVNLPGSCPANFLCRFSSTRNKYFCCQPRTGNMCPGGRALYRSSKTQQPTRCQLAGTGSSQGVCPNGFSCQSRVNGELHGYCCSIHDVCKNGADFLIDERTQMPRTCAPGAFAGCPEAFRCHRSPMAPGPTGHCCRLDPTLADIGGCPPGEFVFSRDGVVVRCDPFDPLDKSCPAKFTCQYSAVRQHYQCCGKDSVVDPDAEETDPSIHLGGGCPSGQVAYIQSAASQAPHVQLCTSSAPNTCPLGYFCQFSERNRQFQCCAHKADCPEDTVAYVDITGLPQECSATPNDQRSRSSLISSRRFRQCPIGYSCRLTGATSNKRAAICCTAETTDQPSSSNNSTSKNNKVPAVVANTERPRPTPTDGQSLRAIIATTIVPKVTLATDPTTTTAAARSSKAKARPGPLERKEKLTKAECRPNEIEVDGACVPRKIGESCLYDEHCPRTAHCVDFTCKCPRGTLQRGNGCIRVKSNESEEETKDEDDREKEDEGEEYGEEESEEEEEDRRRKDRTNKTRGQGKSSPHRKCAPDEVLYKGLCLPRHISIGGHCQINEQCEHGNAECRHQRCECTEGKAAFRNRCHANVCGSNRFKLPQLNAIGSVVLCGPSHFPCLQPHRCTFSRVLHEHICCRTADNARITVGTIRIKGRKGGKDRPEKRVRPAKKGRVISNGGKDRGTKRRPRPVLRPDSEPDHFSGASSIAEIIARRTNGELKRMHGRGQGTARSTESTFCQCSLINR